MIWLYLSVIDSRCISLAGYVIYIVVSMDTYADMQICDGGPSYAGICHMGNSIGGNLYTKRTMFPVRLPYASSVRKARGSTRENGVVIGLAKDIGGGWGPRIYSIIIICSMYKRPAIWRIGFFDNPRKRFS